MHNCNKTFNTANPQNHLKTTRTSLCLLSQLPFLLLLFSFLQFLQIFLSEFDNVSRLLLGGQKSGGKGAGPSKERLTVGGTGQILPQILTDSLALQEFCPEDSIKTLTDCNTEPSLWQISRFGPSQMNFICNINGYKGLKQGLCLTL